MTERPDLDFGYNFGYAVENPYLDEKYKKQLREYEEKRKKENDQTSID